VIGALLQTAVACVAAPQKTIQQQPVAVAAAGKDRAFETDNIVSLSNTPCPVAEFVVERLAGVVSSDGAPCHALPGIVLEVQEGDSPFQSVSWLKTNLVACTRHFDSVWSDAA